MTLNNGLKLEDRRFSCDKVIKCFRVMELWELPTGILNVETMISYIAALDILSINHY